MSDSKMKNEFAAWYLAEVIESYGKGVRAQAKKNLAWVREDGSYADPMLRLGLMAWEASRVPAWQPIDTCPEHEEVLFFRADAGVFTGKIADADTFMDDKQRDEWEGSEEDLYCLDAFGYGPWGVCRCDGSERPTHWMPLPAEPEVTP